MKILSMLKKKRTIIGTVFLLAIILVKPITTTFSFPFFSSEVPNNEVINGNVFKIVDNDGDKILFKVEKGDASRVSILSIGGKSGADIINKKFKLVDTNKNELSLKVKEDGAIFILDVGEQKVLNFVDADNKQECLLKIEGDKISIRRKKVFQLINVDGKDVFLRFEGNEIEEGKIFINKDNMDKKDGKNKFCNKYNSGGKDRTDCIGDNKFVLLNIWATWCSACMGKIPDLVKLYKEHSNNMSVVGINIDQKSAQNKILNAIKKNGINYSILLDPETKVISSLKLGNGIPIFIILDQNGNVMYSGYDSLAFRQKLEGIIKKGEALERKVKK
ncbi:MAG: TlpA disulfide reductase family protein [bacterium]